MFIDESGISTKMARLRSRSLKGERCRAPVPHGHWKTITLVAGLRLNGVAAPALVDGAMDGETFLTWTPPETAAGPAFRIVIPSF